jgi:hypothetical protein
MEYREFREKYNVKGFIVFSLHQYYSFQIMITEKRQTFGNTVEKHDGKVQLEDIAIDNTVKFNYILRKL